MSASKSTNEGTPRSQLLVTTSPRRTRFATALLAALLALTLALAPRAEAYVYWDSGFEIAPFTVQRTIGRANLDGSGTNTKFIVHPAPPGGPGPEGGVTVGKSHLYWVNGLTATIGRANLDGTGLDDSFITDAGDRGGVAVDDLHLYWVSRHADDRDNYNSGAIARANLDGTGVDKSFITGVNFPAGPLAVDGSHLYWAAYSTPPGGLYATPTHIGRANLDGTGVDQNFITNGAGPLAVDDTHIWWAFSGRSSDLIERANLDGSGAEVVIGGVSACGVAVDDTHVYWNSGRSIGRAKLDGTRANREFITGIGDRCGEVAVDALGPRPSNEFSFGKVKKNKRKGTVKLTVKVPGPGELELAKTKKVRADDESAEEAGKEKLSIKPKGKAKKKLNRRGKAKVKAKVTYTPDGGEPNTQSKRMRLVKRR